MVEISTIHHRPSRDDICFVHCQQSATSVNKPSNGVQKGKNVTKNVKHVVTAHRQSHSHLVRLLNWLHNLFCSAKISLSFTGSYEWWTEFYVENDKTTMCKHILFLFFFLTFIFVFVLKHRIYGSVNVGFSHEQIFDLSQLTLVNR